MRHSALEGRANAGGQQVVLLVLLGQVTPRVSSVRDDVDAFNSDVAEVGELVDAVRPSGLSGRIRRMRGRRGARRGPAPVRSRRDRRGADSPRSGTRCRHQGGPGPDERARRGNKVRESPGHHPLDDLVHLFLDQPGYSRDAHGPALIDFRGR